MATISPLSAGDRSGRIRRLQTLTIFWMSVEALASLWAAWRARSPALLAFGGDSAIELLSALAVLWQFQTGNPNERTERTASRIAGASLFLLAAYVLAASLMALVGHSEPKPSYFGVAVLIAAAAIMPWLASEKRRLSAIVGSASLRADATQSAVCACLSVISLAGIATNAIWHITWADPTAALAIIPLVILEGRRAIRGQACTCA